MIPNIIFAVKCKDGFENYIQGKWGKVLEIFEQIGRYGCFVTMIFNIPGTCIGFPSDTAFAIYLFNKCNFGFYLLLDLDNLF
ncbi:MAG: hypothetical protein IKA37_03865 [Spirochaetales bacterium]|nr:hypothetical protein [Spirochaetales bacterium]